MFDFLSIVKNLIKGKGAIDSAATVCHLASGVIGSLDSNPDGFDDVAATLLEATADVLDAYKTGDQNTISKALDAVIAGATTAKEGLTANGICK
jgi:hypothetical protein